MIEILILKKLLILRPIPKKVQKHGFPQKSGWYFSNINISIFINYAYIYSEHVEYYTNINKIFSKNPDVFHVYSVPHIFATIFSSQNSLRSVQVLEHKIWFWPFLLFKPFQKAVKSIYLFKWNSSSNVPKFPNFKPL